MEASLAKRIIDHRNRFNFHLSFSKRILTSKFCLTNGKLKLLSIFQFEFLNSIVILK